MLEIIDWPLKLFDTRPKRIDSEHNYYNASNVLFCFNRIDRFGFKFTRLSNVSLKLHHYDHDETIREDDDLDDGIENDAAVRYRIDSNYLESISMFLFFGIIMMAIIKIFFATLLVICSLRSRSNSIVDKKPVNRFNFLTILFFLLTLLTMATYRYGYEGQRVLDQSSLLICHQLDEVDSILIDHQTKTDKILHEAPMELEIIDKNLEVIQNDAKQTALESRITTIITEYHQLELPVYLKKLDMTFGMNQRKYTKKFHDLSSALCHRDRRENETIINGPNDSESNHKGTYIVLAMASLTLILLFTLISGKYFFCFGCCFGYIFLQILLVTSILAFLYLIISSDICLQFQSILIDLLEMVSNESQPSPPSTPSSSIYDYVEYYLKCPLQQSSLQSPYRILNELQTKLNESESKLMEFDKEIKFYLKQWKQHQESLDERTKKLSVDLERFSQESIPKLMGFLEEFQSIIDQLRCAKITSKLNWFLTEYCTNIYNSVFFFFVNIIGASIGYCFLLTLSIYILLS
ncbi:hypothetical protein SSS_04084 [Sarcoptes scabiei]|uniref:Protein tweety homolog n=1 Tax=Sarcoptes scabiei TaxID=52283 RepID=A0A834VA20_SARSC|nr:hypothetical protein SSS_04084 [Sarcoptes scabiei]